MREATSLSALGGPPTEMKTMDLKTDPSTQSKVDDMVKTSSTEQSPVAKWFTENWKMLAGGAVALAVVTALYMSFRDKSAVK